MNINDLVKNTFKKCSFYPSRYAQMACKSHCFTLQFSLNCKVKVPLSSHQSGTFKQKKGIPEDERNKR